MEFEVFGKYQDIALVITDEMLIYDAESAIELIKKVKKGINLHKFIISKSCVDENFFNPSCPYGGTVFAKYINSRIQIAIVGDYSCFEGQKTMRFLQEINKGDRIFFTDSLDEAIKRLEINI